MEKESRSSRAYLMERFPEIGLMLGVWKKGEIFVGKWSEECLEDVDTLYVYGLGNGGIFFQLEKWLLKKTDRRVVFLEDDPGQIVSFIDLENVEKILKSPQVHLHYLQNKEEDLDILSKRFPSRSVELIFLSSKKNGKKLRLDLLRKTAYFYSLHIDRLEGSLLFYNFLKNIKHLPTSFYANSLKDSFKNVPAVVCGAGPSLSKTLDVLKTLEDKAVIIAGGSTIAALSSQGILPHFAIAVDPNVEEYDRMKNSFAFEVPFLYSTRVNPKVFQTCNGPFGYMRSGIGGSLEIWMEESLGLLEPLLGEDNFSQETMSVTSICVAWAQFLGCNPILLNGIDMAYTNNSRYSEGVTFEEEKIEPLSFNSSDMILKKKGRKGKFVKTAIRWVMESSSISYFAKKHPGIDFINTTEDGLGFKGISYQPIEDVVQMFKKTEIRSKVNALINHASMPKHTSKIIENKLNELFESLERTVEHLRVLTKEKKGSTALAELELQEELAVELLFYDISDLFKKDDCFWGKYLDLVLGYTVFVKLISQSSDANSQ